MSKHLDEKVALLAHREKLIAVRSMVHEVEDVAGDVVPASPEVTQEAEGV